MHDSEKEDWLSQKWIAWIGLNPEWLESILQLIVEQRIVDDERDISTSS